MLEPIYTLDSCPNPAYQLNWSYTLFWHNSPNGDDWLDELQRLNEVDGIRILRHEFTSPKISQFFVSTTPSVIPQVMVQRIKGRLQAIIRREYPKAFQRNYALRSIGSVDRQSVDQYIAGQLEHHLLVDPKTDEMYRRFQFHDPSIDLAQPSRTSHAVYWYNLHLVLVNDGRYRFTDPLRLGRLWSMIRANAKKKQHWLSRFGILPDHIHVSLRANLYQSPATVAFGYMNNLVYVLGMRPEFYYSYYTGTFSEYSTRAVPRT
jgi:REP element-mobilizing transposase RayT